jgi:hypothetical protein
LRLRVFICLRFVQGTCNSLNHVNFGTPGQLNFENLTNFSGITGLNTRPRIVQLGLKLYFCGSWGGNANSGSSGYPRGL